MGIKEYKKCSNFGEMKELVWFIYLLLLLREILNSSIYTFLLLEALVSHMFISLPITKLAKAYLKLQFFYIKIMNIKFEIIGVIEDEAQH